MTPHITDAPLILWTLAACCLAVAACCFSNRARLRAGSETAFWLAWTWLDGQRIRLRVLLGMRQAQPVPEVTEAWCRHPAVQHYADELADALLKDVEWDGIWDVIAAPDLGEGS
jgi:hypothetical protein